MPAKSNGSSKPKRGANRKKKAERRSVLARPFPAAIARQAAKLAARYQVVLETEEGHWYGRGVELPDVFADGTTPDACVAATQKAMSAAVAFLLEEGQTPPVAASTGRRTQQVNVRLTAEEKARIETSARRKGFRGLSDYLRAAALDESGEPATPKRRRRHAS
jgi:predicted RNase H-like HicB family nuclease